MNASNMKRIHTVNEKYGVDNVSQLRNIQDKRRYTFDQKRTMLQFDPPLIKHEISVDNLTLYRLNKQISDEWLNMYHPLKAPRGNLLCLGLVKDDTIYCLMTFKNVEIKDTMQNFQECGCFQVTMLKEDIVYYQSMPPNLDYTTLLLM